MRRRIFIAGLLSAYALRGRASALFLRGGNYIPPLLIDTLGVPAAAAYSVRWLRKNYSGPLLALRRSSDNATMIFSPTSQGVLNAVAIAAWIGSGNTGFVTTWYDQSGNGLDLTQGTEANQPAFIPQTQISVMGGVPAVAFDGHTTVLSNSSFAIAPPMTIFAAARRDANPGVSSFVFSPVVGTTGEVLCGFDTSVDTAELALYGGAAFDAVQMNATPHALAYLANSASSSIWVDNAKTTGMVTASVASNGLAVGNLFPNGNHYFPGTLGELIVFSGDQTVLVQTIYKSQLG